MNSHLSRPAVSNGFKPPLWNGRAAQCSMSRCCSGWGLHSTPDYPGIGGLLPHLSTLTWHPKMQAVYFCCTFLKVAFTGNYPAPLPCGARTFLAYYLSVRTRGCPACSIAIAIIYHNSIFIKSL